MSIGQAFFGGVSSFFSEWIFCLLQITPFFLAFTVGSTVSPEKENQSYPQWKKILLVTVVPLIGFSLVFIPMGMITTGISKALFRYLELANQFGGVLIGLIGCYLAGLLTINESSSVMGRRLMLGAGFLLGVSLALAYKPCVTPTLTGILSLCSSVKTANIGAVMLSFYTIGVSLAILSSGIVLAVVSSRIPSVLAKNIIKKSCGVVLLAASFLILSGKMTDYKSFLVGRFIPQASSVTVPAVPLGEANRK